MGKSWTEEQLEVIKLRNRSLLVSAAAGSGKTAVLVERIIQKITDESHPLNIDELLVVTFTKAAASEMRERILAVLNERLEKEPENVHFQKQRMLLSTAMITTIDSFCMNIVRENYDRIDLDPSFTVGDPHEMTILKQDVVEELLNDRYEQQDPSFIHFVDVFSKGKLDEGLGELILRLYEVSQSFPWPEQWLAHVLDLNLGSNQNPEEKLFVIETIYEETMLYLKEAKMKLSEGIDLCEEVSELKAYYTLLNSDHSKLEAVSKDSNFESMSETLNALKWDRLPSSRKLEDFKEDIERIKVLRDEAKKLVNDLKKNYYSQSLEQIFLNEREILPDLQVLVELTKEFSKRFMDEKRQRNRVDFSDLEHFTLKILLNEDHEPSEIAKRYRDRYEEIMCDEYQDSNEVQETLLTAISREAIGKPNIFIVGDVKQSIYRFRMAEPEIFLKKYRDFTKEESGHQRIDLHKNFRSRSVVLNAINFIFERLMHPKVCGMVYDEHAALYPGLEYPETEYPVADSVEWIMVDHMDAMDMTKREAEAKAVGVRIRQLVDPEQGLWIMDPETGTYRRANYGDIVILLRTVKGWSDDYVRILKDMNIPAVGETSTGFFDSIEIQGILNMLKILDNPRQDIPMAAVLTSPMVGLTDEELAKIRIVEPKISLYEDLKLFETLGVDALLTEKVQQFLALYDELRGYKVHLSIEALLHKIYERTGYLKAMFAFSGGTIRKANLERLVDYAIEFKKTSYYGLFYFLRYIDQLKEAEEDLGNSVLSGDDGKAVRIMSIHKSKGLEYPICIVAGLGKQMNFMESRSRVVIHPKYGLAADGVSLETRSKIPSLTKKIFSKLLLRDQIGEEIRVLYVALTRAREKLILIGTESGLTEKKLLWELNGKNQSQLAYGYLLSASSYNTWIGTILSNLYLPKDMFKVDTFNLGDFVYEKIQEEIQEARDKNQWLEYETDAQTESECYHLIEERFQWQYPKLWKTRLHGKLSVSDLKKMSGESILGDVLIPAEKKAKMTDEDPSKYFAQQKGTATHKILELLPMDRIYDRDEVDHFIVDCIGKGKIPDFWRTLIPVDSIVTFLNSDLGKRIIEAKERNQLYREQPFVMGIPVNEVYPTENVDPISEDRILVQGIIDIFFEEPDGVVLLDYKTDRIPSGKDGDRLLVQRYKTQMDYYQKAIEQITGKKVKDRILYSVVHNREVHC